MIANTEKLYTIDLFYLLITIAHQSLKQHLNVRIGDVQLEAPLRDSSALRWLEQEIDARNLPVSVIKKLEGDGTGYFALCIDEYEMRDDDEVIWRQRLWNDLDQLRSDYLREFF